MKGCVGAPDWIIEIVSPGSRKMDYFTKLFKYRTADVREYWLVDPDKNRILVYNFESEILAIILSQTPFHQESIQI